VRNRYIQSLVSLALVVIVSGAWMPLEGQARFQSNGSGAWSAPGTWLLVAGTSGTGVPAPPDTVDILAGAVISTGATTADCARLTVEANGTLVINGTGSVQVNGNPGSATVYGTLTMSSSGTLMKQGAGTCSFAIAAGGKMTISGSAANPAFDSYSYDPASTEEFTASADQAVLSGTSQQAIVYGNLTLGGSGRKTASVVNVDTTFRCAGVLTVGSNVYFDVSTKILRIYFGGDVVNYGTIDASVGITVLWMTGSHWLNYGTYLPSTTPGFGYSPATVFVNTVIGGSPAAQTFYDLLVQGTMTAGNNLTVTRNVTIAPGGTLNGGASLTHAVGGNWTNNGTFNCGTSTVNFIGKFGRSISGSTFYNVILNDSLGATLTGSVTVASGGSLVLIAGNISTGANALIIAANDPASFSPGAWKVTGTVVRSIAPGSTGTYCFFDANSYVIPGGTGNPGTISASVFPGTYPPGLPPAVDTNVVLKRYCTITGAGSGPGFTYTLRLSYDRSEVRGIEQIYTFWANCGSGWVNAGTLGGPDTTNHFAQQVSLTGWSDWMMAEASAPLPIQLTSFQASPVSSSGSVNLAWATASEINNYGFYVQRSAFPSSAFAELPGGFVAGSGTSLGTRQYAWVDRNPLAGTNYYRLRQVDLDGSSRFTEPLKVVQGAVQGGENARQPAVFALGQNYPNPFNPTTRITFTVDNPGYTTLKVYNILGDEVAPLFEGMTQTGTEYNVAFDGSSLANGAYFYRLVSGEKVSLKKMVLVK
jgi:hypothetical protein